MPFAASGIKEQSREWCFLSKKSHKVSTLNLLGTLSRTSRQRLTRGEGGNDEMVGWHHQLNGHEFEQTLGDGEGQGGLRCCSPWGHRVGHDLATEQ